jgi:hypothetical protein
MTAGPLRLLQPGMLAQVLAQALLSPPALDSRSS